jgi:hypothetical protein
MNLMNYTSYLLNGTNLTSINDLCKYRKQFLTLNRQTDIANIIIGNPLFLGAHSETFQLSETDSEYERIINGKPGYILWGVLFVLLTIFGNIGNIVTIIVLKRDPIISTLTILLIGLAISDILAPQANALLAFTHYHLSHRYANSVAFLKFNNYVRFLVQPLGSMFTMSSSWIITTTTLFRLIAVMCPFKARTLINKRFAIGSLLCIFLFSLASMIPIYASLVTKVRCTFDRKHAYFGYDIDIKSDILKIAYIPVLQILCFYLPWLTSLLLWFFLIRSLRNAERSFNPPKESFYSGSTMSNYAHYNSQSYSSSTKRNSSHKNVNGSVCSTTTTATATATLVGLHGDDYIADVRMNFVQNRIRSYNRITLMIVVLCFINLICQLFTFVFIFELVYNKIVFSSYLSFMSNNVDNVNNSTVIEEAKIRFLDAKSRFPKFLSYSLLLNNICLGINHSCNLFIYTFTNPRFKHNLINLIKRLSYSLCKRFFIGKKKAIYKFNGKSIYNGSRSKGSGNSDYRRKQSGNHYSVKPLFTRNNSDLMFDGSLKHHQQQHRFIKSHIKGIMEAEENIYRSENV